MTKIEIRKRQISIQIRKLVSNPLFIALLIYSISILLLNCWGNFPLNDDFYYFTQVKAFSNGIFTKSALIGPTFILQGLMGLFWTKFFGLTYVSLRVLTLLITVFGIVGLDKILITLKIQPKLRLLALILIIFIPHFYVNSPTFMTENYFLFFVIWSVYYFLTFFNTKNNKHLFPACILGGLSIMIRQYGLVLFITYLLVYITTNYNKISFKKLLIILIPFILISGAGLLWPKFKSAGDLKSMNILLFFAPTNLFVSRITSPLTLPYIGFLLLPFTTPLFLKQKNILKLANLAVSAPISYEFFKIDIFKIGNLFYLEGLYARLLVNIRENLFNNTPFKLFVAYLISVSLISILFFMTEGLVRKLKETNRFEKIKLKNKLKHIDAVDLTLVLLMLGFYTIAVITDRVFDRYLVDFFVVLMIYVVLKAQEKGFRVNKICIFMALFICSITYLLSFHYYRDTQLKWKLANKLIDMGVGKYEIFIDNAYARATYMELKDNYDGRYAAKPQNYRPLCFVQEYIKQDKNLINLFITYVNNRAVVRKYFSNPTVLNAGLLKEKSNHFDSTDMLIFDEQYSSPVYNLLGKKTFVRAFCTKYYTGNTGI